MSFVPKRIEDAIKLLTGMVEFVTDVVIDDDGKFSALGVKSDDDDGHPIKGDTGWHLGFYSRPLDGGTGAVVKPGGKSGAAFLFCWRNRQYEVALEKGEVAVANEAGAVSKWDKNGKITHTAKAGQIVAINGEDYDLPKWNDFLTDFNSLVTVLGIIVASSTAAGPLTGLALAYTGPPHVPPYATNADALAGLIATFATLTPYKSTKAKNG